MDSEVLKMDKTVLVHLGEPARPVSFKGDGELSRNALIKDVKLGSKITL